MLTNSRAVILVMSFWGSGNTPWPRQSLADTITARGTTGVTAGGTAGGTVAGLTGGATVAGSTYLPGGGNR